MNSDTYILPREGQFGNAKVEEGGCGFPGSPGGFSKGFGFPLNHRERE